ncbi:MAG: hypothetical protein WDN75_05505 [Bacteroidota bacterium]
MPSDMTSFPPAERLRLRDFKYVAKGQPQVTLSQADMTFNPQKIELSKLDGTVGKSDFSVTGNVSNYIAYVLIMKRSKVLSYLIRSCLT